MKAAHQDMWQRRGELGRTWAPSVHPYVVAPRPSSTRHLQDATGELVKTRRRGKLARRFPGESLAWTIGGASADILAHDRASILSLVSAQG